MQRCEMVRLADVQDLDLDPTFILVREILEHRSAAAAAASDRADDVPSFLQEFRGHGVAETARGADEKDCLGAVAQSCCGHDFLSCVGWVGRRYEQPNAGRQTQRNQSIIASDAMSDEAGLTS